MSDPIKVPGLRTFSGYLATGGVAILALIALNVAADKTKWKGLQTLRDAAVRRNG